jgi:hypothetical protein
MLVMVMMMMTMMMTMITMLTNDAWCLLLNYEWALSSVLGS